MDQQLRDMWLIQMDNSIQINCGTDLLNELMSWRFSFRILVISIIKNVAYARLSFILIIYDFARVSALAATSSMGPTM